MGRRRKYADLVLLSDGRYEKTITRNGVRHKFRSTDPEVVYAKVDAFLNPPKTFRAAAMGWMEDHFPTISPGTRSSYKGAYDRAVEAFGDLPAADITPAQLDGVLEKMKRQGYAASTVQKQKIVFRQIFNYAIREMGVQQNPMATVSLPKNLPKATREAPEDATVEQIRASLDCYWGLFAYFLLHTGLRKGEALAITGADIDRKRGVIHVRRAVAYDHGMAYLKTPKSAAGIRDVPLLDPLAAVLPPLRPDELLFPQENGSPMSDKTYQRHWRHYCKDAGFISYEPIQRVNKKGKPYVYQKPTNTLTAHQLRHGYATILYEAGIDAQVAKNLLGHSDITVTLQIYTHIRNRKRNSAADILNDYFKGCSANNAPVNAPAEASNH